MLLTFGALLIASVLIWVRSGIGLIVSLAIGILVILIGTRETGRLQKLTLQILGVQACISTFRDFDYLFTSGGQIGGEQFSSDTTVISSNTGLPFWFWAIVLTIFSIAILLWSIRAKRTTP